MKFKKIISMILCCVMLMSLTVTVFAERVDFASSTSSYTIDEGEGIGLYLSKNDGFLKNYEVTTSSGSYVASGSFGSQPYSSLGGTYKYLYLDPGTYKIKCFISGYTLQVSGSQYIAIPNSTGSYVTKTVKVVALQNFTGITFNGDEVVYDGTEKSISVSGAPSGATVTYTRLNNHNLLIIDDLGMERNTEYALEQVYNVIDSRYRTKKPLIVTTNLSITEIKDTTDTAHKRIYDRILEMCIPIKFDGDSIRRTIAKDKRTYIKNIFEEAKID